MTIKTSWNLKLLYKSEKDPQIEKDLRAIEKAFTEFEKKYKGRDFTSSAKRLKAALDDSNDLEKILNGLKIIRYFNYKIDINSQDENAQAKSTQYSQRIKNVSNKTTFFRLALGKIPSTQQKKLLKSPELKEYAYLLKVIFDKAKHYLTEDGNFFGRGFPA
jgi:oligoendopeptidase F